jgi:hypothetical protein
LTSCDAFYEREILEGAVQYENARRWLQETQQSLQKRKLRLHKSAGILSKHEGED